MRIGQGINLSGGQINTAPITAAGQSIANSVKQAGAAQGQMYAGLGQSIAQGVQSFQQRQKENAILTGNIGAMAQQAGLVDRLDDKNKKLLDEFIDPDKELNNKKLSQLMSALTVAGTQQQQEQQSQKLQAQIGQIGAQTALTVAQAQESGMRAQALQNPQSSISPAVRDARAVVKAEIEAGTLTEDGAAARFAQLVASGGQDRATPKAEYGGTYIKRDGSGETVRAALFPNGIIGTMGEDGKIVPIDQKEWQSVTAGDANLYLDPTQVSKMSQDLIKEENGIRSLTNFFEGVEDLPVGIEKLASRISRAAKAFMGDEELTDEEVELGISQARQQALLGKIRTDVLGPGVLTEIDAQRLIGSLGGDISSVFTQPKIVAKRLYETLQQKHRAYEDLLRQYNAQVAGRYGSMGHRQRELLPLPSLENQPSSPAPEGVPQDTWDSWTKEKKDEFLALGVE